MSDDQFWRIVITSAVLGVWVSLKPWREKHLNLPALGWYAGRTYVFLKRLVIPRRKKSA